MNGGRKVIKKDVSGETLEFRWLVFRSLEVLLKGREGKGRGGKCCRELKCWRSLRTLNLVCCFFSGELWEDPRSRFHMEARFIPLDKAWPCVPNPSEYRPFVAVRRVVRGLINIFF